MNLIHNLTYTAATRIYFAFSFMFVERVAAARCIHSISEFIYVVPVPSVQEKGNRSADGGGAFVVVAITAWNA